MKNKTYYAFGYTTYRYDNKKIKCELSDTFVTQLKNVKKLTGEQYDALENQLTHTEANMLSVARYDEIKTLKNGVIKLLGEETVAFVAKDLNMAKIAFADYYVNNECF